MTDKLLETVELETQPNPAAAVIWMHGLGADGNDFVPIVNELSLKGLPGIRFVFPHAPQRPVTLNNGYVMRAWYDISPGDLDASPSKPDEQGVRESQGEITKLIARENSRGIPANKIVLAGFSQGGAIALQSGLRYPERLAGIMALSTYLPIADKVAAEATAVNKDVPIFMVHGSDDGVIPIYRAQQSREILAKLGYAIEWHEYGMQHSVCMEEVRDISGWLQKVLAA